MGVVRPAMDETSKPSQRGARVALRLSVPGNATATEHSAREREAQLEVVWCSGANTCWTMTVWQQHSISPSSAEAELQSGILV